MSERLLLHEERKSGDRATAMETDFLARVAQLRDELHIRSAQGGTRDRQRIALAVVDGYLRTVNGHARWHELRGGRQVMDEQDLPGGVHLGGATDQAPGNHPGGPGAVDGPGAALHPRRPPALLPRGQRGRLARPPGEGPPGRLGPAKVRGQKAPRAPRDDAREG